MRLRFRQGLGVCGLLAGAVDCGGRTETDYFEENRISSDRGEGATDDGKATSNSPGGGSGAKIDNVDGREILALDAGYAHSCASLNGTLYCWGSNLKNQLGNATMLESTVPVRVEGMPASVTAVAVGFAHSCAASNSDVICWGDNSEMQRGAGRNIGNSGLDLIKVSLRGEISAMDAGSYHTCAIAGNRLFCWGANDRWQLGVDLGSAASSSPVTPLGNGTDVNALAVGAHHACAIVDGYVYCWGANVQGPLGLPSGDGRSVPVLTPDLQAKASGIGAGDAHTCVIVEGEVLCWGNNEWGQLGGRTTADTSRGMFRVQGLSDVTALALGSFHSCALSQGGVKCWGFNGDGQLGSEYRYSSIEPQPVKGLDSGVTQIAAGSLHTCAAVNGEVRCWGDNRYGQLGIGSKTASAEPALAKLP